MAEEFQSGLEGQEAAPSAERDFSTDPATPEELGEWTEMYRVAPDTAPVETSFAEPPVTPDLSVYEETPGVASGQELAPLVDEVTPVESEVVEETPERQLTSFGDAIEDGEVIDEPTPEPAPVETKQVETQPVEEADVPEAAPTEQTSETFDTSGMSLREMERLARNMQEYDAMRYQPGGYFVPFGAYDPRYVRVERPYGPDPELLRTLQQMLRDAERSGDRARIAELERQLASEQARTAEAGEGSKGEQPPANVPPAEQAAGAGEAKGPEQPAVEGEYIPKGQESAPQLEHAEAAPQLEQQEAAPQLEHQEQPALEHKP